MRSGRDLLLSVMGRLHAIDQECLITFKLRSEEDPSADWGRLPAPVGEDDLLKDAKRLSAEICGLNFDGSCVPKFPLGANSAHMILDPSSDAVFFILEGDDFYDEKWLSTDGIHDTSPEPT